MFDREQAFTLVAGTPVGGGTAGPAALVSEDFDDVTYGSPRSVSNVLTNSPGQLPSGTLWFSANAAVVNVCTGNDAINTSTGNQGFDGFFGSNPNRFLVLGDRAGAIGGVPNTGVFGFAIPFTVQPGTTALTVSFDWAYDGADSSANALQTDRFVSAVVGGSISWSSFVLSTSGLVAKTSPGGFGDGQFSQTLANPVAGNYLLAFGLLEAGGSQTNTAPWVSTTSP